jgi:hypothetical protein
VKRGRNKREEIGEEEEETEKREREREGKHDQTENMMITTTVYSVRRLETGETSYEVLYGLLLLP